MNASLPHPNPVCILQTRITSVSPSDHFVSHYIVDKGRRILVGLSFEETAEFERLDARLPYDGKPIWPSDNSIVPLVPMEMRWLELYRKHRTAFDAMQNKLPNGHIGRRR